MNANPCPLCGTVPDIVPHSTDPVSAWHTHNTCLLANRPYSLKEWNRGALYRPQQDDVSVLLAEHIFELNPEERRDALEAVDPDWTDHWRDWDEAFRSYWQDDAARADMVKALAEGYK